MKHLGMPLIIIVSLLFSTGTVAIEVSQCTNFKSPVAYDMNGYKYRKVFDPEIGEYWNYLSGSIFIKEVDPVEKVEIWIDNSIILLEDGRGIIKYREGFWKRLPTAGNGSITIEHHQLVERIFTTTFETTWKVVDNILYVDGVGYGQPAHCFDNGITDLYFTYENYPGKSSLVGRSLVLQNGGSNYDPMTED